MEQKKESEVAKGNCYIKLSNSIDFKKLDWWIVLSDFLACTAENPIEV